MQYWTLTVASPRRSADFAARAEAAGWHGMLVVDSQNLSGDPYVALAMAATTTSTLGLGTGVTNHVTRHPAVTASAIASIQKLSNGRACLGIGRGDSALAHLGHAPGRLGAFEKTIQALQIYLAGGAVAFSDSGVAEDLAPPVADLHLADTPQESRIAWLSRDAERASADKVSVDKVSVEVAATGPKVIGIAARHADRIMFTLGADVERLEWGIATAREAAIAHGRDPAQLRFGAYINLACHPQIEVARSLTQGGLTTFARFSVMHGPIAGPVQAADAQVLEQLHDTYNMKQHTRGDSPQAQVLTAEFIDRFAVVGDVATCRARIAELGALGIDKLAISGPTFAAKSAAAQHAARLLETEILNP